MKLACNCLLLLTLTAVGGCQGSREPSPWAQNVPVPPNLADTHSTCSNDRARFGLGRTISEPLLEEMRVRSGANKMRTVPLGDPRFKVQDDATRLTIEVDKGGRITAVECG